MTVILAETLNGEKQPTLCRLAGGGSFFTLPSALRWVVKVIAAVRPEVINILDKYVSVITFTNDAYDNSFKILVIVED